MRLTDRQTAVLAAVERRGTAKLPWIAWEDFPQLSPSVVLGVLESLERRGLVRGEGQRALVYCGGVEFVAPRKDVVTQRER